MHNFIFFVSSQACDYTYKASRGRVQHAPYPLNYLPNRECSYTINIPSNRQIVFYFNRFDLEKSPQCRNDYLEISRFDYDNRQRLIGRYCGNSAPPRVRAYTRMLIVRFKSNANIQKRGFRAYYFFEPVTQTTKPPTTTATTTVSPGKHL